MMAKTELALRAARGDFRVRVLLRDLPLTRVGESLWWQAERGPVFRTRRGLNRAPATLSVFSVRYMHNPRWAVALYALLRTYPRSVFVHVQVPG